jgi:peptidyl-tRNA hydrolase
MLEEWLYGGQPKVVVKAPDEQTLFTLMEAARAMGVGVC